MELSATKRRTPEPVSSTPAAKRPRHDTDSDCAVTARVSTQDIHPDPAASKHTDLIASILARCDDNESLITAIYSYKQNPYARRITTQLEAGCSCTVTSEKYSCSVRAKTISVPLDSFVARWRPSDTSYDETTADYCMHINWRLDSFATLVETNRLIRPVAASLAMAEGSLKSKEVLVKLLRNATKMGEQLRQLLGLIEDSDAPTVEDSRAKCTSLQHAFETAVAEVLREHGAEAARAEEWGPHMVGGAEVSFSVPLDHLGAPDTFIASVFAMAPAMRVWQLLAEYIGDDAEHYYLVAEPKDPDADLIVIDQDTHTRLCALMAEAASPEDMELLLCDRRAVSHGKGAVVIKSLTGGTVEIPVNFFKDTVRDVKLAYQDIFGIPAEEQRLICHGKLLEDSKRIYEYGITFGSNIHQVLKLRGD